MWVLWAFGSALCAGLSSVLAKCGVKHTGSTLATALRTVVVLAMAWAVVFLAGAQAGSIAFLSNLLREIFSFFSIPLISRKLNYYTCIAPAGATSEDTTLPMMIRYTNEETVVLSVFNGVICSAAVPFLISFCYNFV